LPVPDAAKLPRKSRYIPGSCLLRAFLCLFLLAAIVFAFVPIFSRTSIRGPQTSALVRTKQIGLALKLYAGDHDGVYPAGVNSYGETIRTSNDAFRSLFPTYLTSESIFGNKLSAYQTAPPDDVILPSYKILRPGENVYSYVAGLDESFNPGTPLVADGTDGTGRGLYVSDRRARGGVWEGTKAVVIRLDNSGALETLAGPAQARFISRTGEDGKQHNILSPESLGPKAKLLDPAVTPPETR
jgi:hypothetical protein